MSAEHDTLLDNCIDALLSSDLSVMDNCVWQLPAHYYTFWFLRLNTFDDRDKTRVVQFNEQPHQYIHILPSNTCGGDCALVNLDHLYSAWDNVLEHASFSSMEQGFVFFSQLPYYSAHANTVWSRSFERYLKQITDTRFSVSPVPTLTSYVSHVVGAFVGVIANACEPIKSELFWRCAAKLDGMEQCNALEDFLRCLVDHGFELNLPSYPFGKEKDTDTSTFIHDVEHRLFQLQGERLKRLAGIDDSGTDSERRKI